MIDELLDDGAVPSRCWTKRRHNSLSEREPSAPLPPEAQDTAGMAESEPRKCRELCNAADMKLAFIGIIDSGKIDRFDPKGEKCVWDERVDTATQTKDSNSHWWLGLEPSRREPRE